MLKVNGIFISLKGKLDNELLNIDNYYQKLFLTDENITTFELPNNLGFRTIYKIKKSR